MDLLAFLGVAVLGGVVGYHVAAVRPARRFEIVFRCEQCNEPFRHVAQNAPADEIDPVGMAVAMGWQVKPNGRWACTAHAWAEAQ